ncbi:hypothetical protein PCE1_002543 [Barthelona sp. PCE]
MQPVNNSSSPHQTRKRKTSSPSLSQSLSDSLSSLNSSFKPFNPKKQKIMSTIALHEIDFDTKERQMPDVKAYPNERIDANEVDWQELLKLLKEEHRLSDSSALDLIQNATIILKAQPNVVDVALPVYCVADVHGQYYDLLTILETVLANPDYNIVFLGDYVDRGFFSTEILFLLMLLIIEMPQRVVLLRGNHECKSMAEYFTFRNECLTKYAPEVYDAFIDFFQALPLGAVIANKFFAVHGGIGPSVPDVDAIRSLDRFCEPGLDGPMCELLWSDPHPDFDHPAVSGTGFSPNDQRGVASFYTQRVLKGFLRRSGLISMIRGHEVHEPGYLLMPRGRPFPLCISLFSAPNYCDMYSNKGAFIELTSKGTLHVKQFGARCHPYWLPGGIDVFSWSLPVVSENLAILVRSMVLMGMKKAMLRNTKAKFDGLSRILWVLRFLREESEIVTQLKTFMSDHLPPHILINGPDKLKDMIQTFNDVKKIDSIAELHPDSVKAKAMRAKNEAELKIARLERLEEAVEKDEEDYVTLVASDDEICPDEPSK